jgi:filamentous hemagglutinin
LGTYVVAVGSSIRAFGAKGATLTRAEAERIAKLEKPCEEALKYAPKGAPALDDLSQAAGAADKNGLTKAGRALQKHSDRPGSAFNNPGSKTPGSLNPAGQNVVDDILTTPGSQMKPNRLGGWDVVAPDGRGVRYNPDGSFYSLLEPKK